MESGKERKFHICKKVVVMVTRNKKKMVETLKL